MQQFRQDLITRIQRAGELHLDNAASMLPPELRYMLSSVVDDLVNSGLIFSDGEWLCWVMPEVETGGNAIV